ncbi:PspC domain-containing protein [Arthrobacter mobilis]|uniref:PspC domain-containing protein n=1 Tax=Arthrobacter mobilis TaxID=2724944 RepID=A0A7X6HAJ9_9MICC|nr:PspC domain-containing protein [Arthrobacter mobilis]NKX53531.1 PspC domain-containing protein [Arthrobacter mobilis]
MTSEPTPHLPGQPAEQPPAQPSGPPQAPPARPASNSFFAWLRNLGIVRGEDRWIGGVAAGTARRTGLDPVLVRGLFILLAVFGGTGVLLYGLAWALLPEPDGRIHAEEAGRRRWSAGMTGAVIVTVLGLVNTPFGIFGPDGRFRGAGWAVLWTAAIIALVVWLSGRRRGPAPGASGPAAGGDYTSFAPAAGPPDAYPAAPGYPATAAYPPDLTPPAGYAAARPARRGPSGPAVAVTLGAAMLLGGLVLALNAARVLELGPTVVPATAAVVLVTLGIGVVAAGIRGRSSGVLGFLAAVGVAAALLASAGVQWQAGNVAVGTATSWSTSGTAPAGEGYSVAAGEGTVDLSGVRPGPAGGPAVVPVNAAAASVEVIIPRGAVVQVRSRLAFGNIEYRTAQGNGSYSGFWRPAVFTLNDNGSPPVLILQIRGAMSSVEVVEGPAAPAPEGTRAIPGIQEREAL